jgi:hypothetical protein
MSILIGSARIGFKPCAAASSSIVIGRVERS